MFVFFYLTRYRVYVSIMILAIRCNKQLPSHYNPLDDTIRSAFDVWKSCQCNIIASCSQCRRIEMHGFLSEVLSYILNPADDISSSSLMEINSFRKISILKRILCPLENYSIFSCYWESWGLYTCFSIMLMVHEKLFTDSNLWKVREIFK